MSPVTLEIQYPHGRVHATAWDRPANAGEVEWPPAPWRLIRALLSAWHTRVPDVPEGVIDDLIAKLSEPPVYSLPPSRPTHTRHYLPDGEFLSMGDKPKTTKTFDAQLIVDREGVLRVHFPKVDLNDVEAAALRLLCSAVPYLGRAESVCSIRLDTGPVDFETSQQWTVPDPEGHDQLLCLTPETTRAELETSPWEMRRSGRLTPEGAQWVAYRHPASVTGQRRKHGSSMEVTSIRWHVVTAAPFMERNGILATSALRQTRLKGLEKGGFGQQSDHAARAGRISGHRDPDAPDQHDGAHWLWLGATIGGREVVQDVALWVPGGIDGDMVGSLLGQELPNYRSYKPAGYVPGALQLVAAGAAKDVLPELVACGLGVAPGATRWVSATPFLMTRHLKRGRDPLALLHEDVRREASYRGLPEVLDVRQLEDDGPTPVRRYRRYRWGEDMSSARYGYRLEILFAKPVTGPISLGNLSHFGFGLFTPRS